VTDQKVSVNNSQKFGLTPVGALVVAAKFRVFAEEGKISSSIQFALDWIAQVISHIPDPWGGAMPECGLRPPSSILDDARRCELDLSKRGSERRSVPGEIFNAA